MQNLINKRTRDLIDGGKGKCQDTLRMQNTCLPKNRTCKKQQNTKEEYETVEIAHAKTKWTYSTCGGRIWRGRKATNLFIRTTLVRSTPVLCCSVSRNCFRVCVLFPFEYLISSRIIMHSIYAFFSWFVLFQRGQICISFRNCDTSWRA